ncbi:hypothetical protein [Rhizobium sp. RU20A]|uniref:hypothetical protein n=1 Tax=Rhizobium sp. RU20A TaxID=1907412 RepID=UPI00165F085D|nr:hypothetical protein [Rhizobium sp. RU20A]
MRERIVPPGETVAVVASRWPPLQMPAQGCQHDGRSNPDFLDHDGLLASATPASCRLSLKEECAFQDEAAIEIASYAV